MTTPPHTTHQAPILLCPDILLEILNHLQPGRRTPQDKKITRKRRLVCRQALLASALTCRTLSDLALDVLWRALDDIQPLLRLLPGHKRTFVLKPHIMPETWIKFQSYATRVREIGHFPNPERVHPSVWTFLAIKCEDLPLLPRLHDLDAYDLLLDDLSPLFLLLTPSLRSISLSVDEGGGWNSTASQVTVLVLQHIARVAPRVKTFHMLGRHCFTTRKHLSMLQNFTGLTELSLGSDFGFSGTILCQLSTTTSLNALTITISHLNPSDLQPLGDNFRLLHRLTLRGALDDLVNFILACRLPLLDALILRVNDCNTPRKLTPGLTSIYQHPDLPKSLTRIGFEFRSGMIGRHQTLTQYLEPLLSFPKVEHCDLNFYNTAPSVCDNDLIRLGDAWPNLQHLNVRGRATVDRYDWDDKYGYSYTLNNTPAIQRPTVLGLTELARRCPTLRYVHLVSVDGGARTPPQGGAASRLRELLFEHVHNASSSAQRCAFAEALDAAFPRLDISLSKAECVYPDVRPEWRRIMLLVRALRYRRNPRLGPDVHSRAAAAVKFAASRKSLAALDKALSDAENGDSDREWDLDSDSDSDPSGSEYSREDSDSPQSDG
ncbi:hypothetical protein LXA43DRAFT_1025836 [Ganoderma leucocontextum]|nr:hypothetical protein LXA43DRAFT_1025836 [Ganoderma leucocontextum]